MYKYKNGKKIKLTKAQEDEVRARWAANEAEETQRQEKENREQLIRDKMREMAIVELQKEGKL